MHEVSSLFREKPTRHEAHMLAPFWVHPGPRLATPLGHVHTPHASMTGLNKLGGATGQARGFWFLLRACNLTESRYVCLHVSWKSKHLHGIQSCRFVVAFAMLLRQFSTVQGIQSFQPLSHWSVSTNKKRFVSGTSRAVKDPHVSAIPFGEAFEPPRILALGFMVYEYRRCPSRYSKQEPLVNSPMSIAF